MKSIQRTIKKLLAKDLLMNAERMGLTSELRYKPLDVDDLPDIIGALDYLSAQEDETSRRQLICMAALLWTHKNDDWTGLKNYLVLFLSRAGFGPSSIMIDSEYSFADHSYSFSESILNEFAITLSQLDKEVRIGEEVFLLTDFQKQLWDAIDENKLIGISAPTSAGKSYLILIKAIQLIKEHGGSVVYIVPTLSLVSQVLSDFRVQLDSFGLSDYDLVSTFNSSASSVKAIYVLTQEKAIAAFSQKEIPFQAIRLLVIDEIQNVERVADSDEHRSKVLYDLMIDLSNTAKIDHIIVSGPRIINIGALSSRIFGINSSEKETVVSPVLNLTYSISKSKGTFFLKVHSDLLDMPEKLRLTHSEAIQGYGKVRYLETYLKFLASFINAFPNTENTLVFSPTSSKSVDIAVYLAQNREIVGNQYLEDLSDFIAETVHPLFPLVETVKKGIGYHHGKLPFHTRLLVEDALKTRNLFAAVCTTTLLQGVNLPVQNIVIRNPNLFIQKQSDSSKLSNYEMANLRGRAGRLLKDFVGRTYVLDEGSFEEESDQNELFADAMKELEVGYGGIFNRHKEKIQSDILEGVGATAKNHEYSFLTTYIRQTVLRYGANANEYLRRVGIDLSLADLNSVLMSFSILKVPKAICLSNRYWDPFDLNKLFLNRTQYILPRDPNEFGNAGKLEKVLTQLQTDIPVYYKRHFNVTDTPKAKILFQTCILAQNWLSEKPLSEILNDDYYDTPEKIDRAVNLLQSKISYGLPLLLKPLYEMKIPTSMFTRFLETGAYKPTTRKLIELNVPRETAIFLTAKFRIPNTENRDALIKQIREIRPTLSYWHKVQLNTL